MRRPTPLLIEERVEASGPRLTLSGELDLTTNCTLRQRLFQSRAAGDEVRLDVSQLEFIDAGGAGLLSRAFANSQRHGWRLKIDSAIQPQVARVLELIGLELPTS